MPTAAERLAALEAEVAALRAQVAEVATLRTQVQELLRQNQQLLARLAKDRHTSSTPPSSDPLAHQRPRSHRRRRGKQPGGPRGHRGQTRRLGAIPASGIAPRPDVCRAGQTPVDETAPVAGDERRHVQELPPVRLVVREQRTRRVRGPTGTPVSVGAVPAAAPAAARTTVRGCGRWRSLASSSSSSPPTRVRELVADLVGVPVAARGTRTRSRGARRRNGPAGRGAAPGGAAPGPRAAQSDATGVRRAGQLAWAPVAHWARTARLTQYAIHAQRGSAATDATDATDAIGILPTSQGVSAPDGGKPARHATPCRHALGTIHPSRAS
jgi:hypothetical protein